MPPPQTWEQVNPHHTSIWFCINGSKWCHKEREKHNDWKGTSKTVIICRKLFFFFTWKTLRHTKEQLLELFNKVTGHRAIYRGRKKYVYASVLCIYILVTIRRWKFLIYNNSNVKKSWVLNNKFNKRHARSLHWEL